MTRHDDPSQLSNEEKWNLLTRPEQLGEVLLKQQKITLKQLDDLLNEQAKTGKHIGELILAKGILTRDQILEALNWQHRSELVSMESVIELKEKQKK